MEQKLKQIKKKYFVYTVLIALLCLVGGFGLGYQVKPTEVLSTKSVRENTNQYTFIHPLLAVNSLNPEKPSPAYIDLNKKVQSFIANQVASAGLRTASVYLINYGKNNGSFAINENESYAPASLLKVVVLVAYLKKSDENLSILNQQFVYAESIDHALETTPFDTPTELKVGSAYSVSTLLEKMIVDSDNGAMDLLLSHIEDAYLTQVYTDLGLAGPKINSVYTISIKDYSLFFRVLYNSSYLSRESSEKALSILSKTTFNDGIVKGLPSDIVVAHKYGEHVNGTGDQIDSIELHDCGIIYNKSGPYMLCVMTKGKTLASLSDTIGGISKIIYDDISSR